jgi:hypothetical protein
MFHVEQTIISKPNVSRGTYSTANAHMLKAWKRRVAQRNVSRGTFRQPAKQAHETKEKNLKFHWNRKHFSVLIFGNKALAGELHGQDHRHH